MPKTKYIVRDIDVDLFISKVRKVVPCNRGTLRNLGVETLFNIYTEKELTKIIVGNRLNDKIDGAGLDDTKKE